MKLEQGDHIPHFILTDAEGNLFDSKEILGNKILVIYFYPKNFTPGCTKEACNFRNDYEEFKKNGAEVIGISSDSVKSHQKFLKKYDLNHKLLSDPTEKIREKFGVKSHALGLIPGRDTFVIDRKGIVQMKFHNLKASQHEARALKSVKKLNDA
jgi:peroxiredoxin Q/BCP